MFPTPFSPPATPLQLPCRLPLLAPRAAAALCLPQPPRVKWSPPQGRWMQGKCQRARCCLWGGMPPPRSWQRAQRRWRGGWGALAPPSTLRRARTLPSPLHPMLAPGQPFSPTSLPSTPPQRWTGWLQHWPAPASLRAPLPRAPQPVALAVAWAWEGGGRGGGALAGSGMLACRMGEGWGAAVGGEQRAGAPLAPMQAPLACGTGMASLTMGGMWTTCPPGMSRAAPGAWMPQRTLPTPL